MGAERSPRLETASQCTLVRYSLNWFVSQSDTPLAPTRGQLVDHIAISVPTLDPWIAKLKADNVTFLRQPYRFGDSRAIMIEGPSRESIEIIGK